MITVPVTYVILGISIVLSLICFNNKELKYKLLFSPYSAKHHKRWYNVITHAFIHGDYIHLFFNMFVLWSFGYQTSQGEAYGLEADFVNYFGQFGQLYYLMLYVGGILFATIPAFYKHSNNPNYMSLGASGAVSALLFSYIILHPFSSLNLMILPGVDIPAIIFGALYLAFEIYASKRAKDNIAHDAHYSGAIFGILLTIALRPSTVTEFIDQCQALFQ